MKDLLERLRLARTPIRVAGSSEDPCLPEHAPIPALALCIAALEAREQTG